MMPVGHRSISAHRKTRTGLCTAQKRAFNISNDKMYFGWIENSSTDDNQLSARPVLIQTDRWVSIPVESLNLNSQSMERFRMWVLIRWYEEEEWGRAACLCISVCVWRVRRTKTVGLFQIALWRVVRPSLHSSQVNFITPHHTTPHLKLSYFISLDMCNEVLRSCWLHIVP